VLANVEVDGEEFCYDPLGGVGGWAKKAVFQRYLICERPPTL